MENKKEIIESIYVDDFGYVYTNSAYNIRDIDTIELHEPYFCCYYKGNLVTKVLARYVVLINYKNE